MPQIHYYKSNRHLTLAEALLLPLKLIRQFADSDMISLHRNIWNFL